MFFQIILLIIFLILFHNLYWKRRNFPPGPTPWPLLGNVGTLKDANPHPPYEILRKWRKDYGEIFTVWMGEIPVVCVADFTLIHETFVRDGDAYAGRADFQTMSKIFRGGSFGVVFTDGEKWREQRRFTLATLREFGMGKNVMQKKILDELEHLFKKFDSFDDNDEIIIGQHMDIFVGSIISSILFGFRYDESNLGDFELLRSSIAGWLQTFGDPIATLLFWKSDWLKKLPKFSKVFEKLMNIRDILFQYIDNQVVDHIKYLNENSSDEDDGENAPTDFIYAYLREMSREASAANSTTFFTRDQLRNLVLDLLVTGQDTTSLTLGFTILYILHHPKVQARLQQELDSLGLSPETFITTAERSRLPYLQAVINEAQRLTNLLPENLLHRTTRDVTIKGFKIKTGTVITPQVSCVLYDEKIFPDPYAFKPERFLDEMGALKKCEEFVPFSVGKRSCIGENLARMELFLVIGNLYKRFEVKPVDEKNLPTLDKLAGLTVHYHPYKCRLTSRIR